MAYQEAVKEAAAALVRGEDANWELARLTHKNTNRAHKPREPHAVSHEQWSENVRVESGRGFSVDTSKKHAAMWERFGDTKVLPNWTESWYEMTPRDQPEPMRARAAKTHVQEATPAQVAETVNEALKRPEVAQAVIADDQSNLAISKARQSHDQEAQAFGEVKDPQRRDARQHSEMADAVYELVRFRNWLFRITDQAKAWEWNDDEQEGWVDAIEGVRGALDSAETAPDFDKRLEELTT